jgi:predicted nicotinamide N-methyase
MTSNEDNARTDSISVQSLFLQKVPLAVILSRVKSLEHWPLIEAQLLVAHMFTDHSEHLPYEWLRSVLKQIVNDLELNGIDVTDKIAELMVHFSRPVQTDEDKSGYIIYSSHETIMRGKSFVYTINLHNQVGMKVWSAGLFSAELLLAAPRLSAGKHVLELGAGTGCTSLIVALSHSPPRRITLTDFHEEVMTNLQCNVDTTICHNSGVGICDITCHRVDWMECQRQNDITSAPMQASLQKGSDGLLILAADCLYSEDLASPLLATISLILHSARGAVSSSSGSSSHDEEEEGQHQQKRPSRVALLATMVRHPDTYLYAQSCLDALTDLVYRDVTAWAFEQCDQEPPCFSMTGERT